VEDYLERFPPDPADVVHVENGAWVGADCGDPEFKKWLSDPNGSGWSPDRNSWAVLTAAKNRVFTAEAVAPVSSIDHVMTGLGTNTERAWHYLLVSEASDYWYWDGTQIWDSNVTRGCNQAVAYADPVIAGQPDTVPPTVFLPQREPYNPGGYEWGASPEPSDFEVWTLVYDASGLLAVTLYWRVDADGTNPLASIQNETYAGGAEVGPWTAQAMTGANLPTPPSGVLAATYRAQHYTAMILGQSDVLIDYFVEAADNAGNVARSPIQHVYVGMPSGGGGGEETVVIDPDPAQAGQNVNVSYDPTGRPLQDAAQVYLHYGFNGWVVVVSPDPAMTWDAGDQVWRVTVPVSSTATQLDLVFHNGSGVWDNNGGQDWHFAVEGTDPAPGWTMDGQLDGDATLIASNQGRRLYAGLQGDTLYVATESAGGGNDHFIFLANPPGSMRSAPWAKAGLVADWTAFLAQESDNGWIGWFDHDATVAFGGGPGSPCLEGTINLAEQYGQLPAQLYLALEPYATPNGGALQHASQVPPSVNGNGNVDPAEFALVDLCSITVGRPAADLNGDCVVDLDDYVVFYACMGGPSELPAPSCPPGVESDQDGDGDTDLADFRDFQSYLDR